MTNEEKLKRIAIEKERIKREIEEHEKTLPDLAEAINTHANQLLNILREVGSISCMDKDDIEWLADDIIDTASELASAVRRLSRCQ